ncbi:MAG: hypothetical protein O2794_02385 [bacterium]|nr:hypothetical protein [bacterium]
MKQLLFILFLIILGLILIIPLPETRVSVLIREIEEEIIFEPEVKTEDEKPTLEEDSPAHVESLVVIKEEPKNEEHVILETQDIAEILEPIAQSIIYDKALLSIVNLVCPVKKNSFAIATGAIVSPEGHILSVAHLTEGLNIGSKCTLRRGSPARDFASAELLFVPDNYKLATTTNSQAPFDFSIWKIITEDKQSFEYWDITTDKILDSNNNVLTLSYAAELNSGSALKNLNLLFSLTTVDFDDSYIVRSKSTISAQEGSSGGILVDPYTSNIRGMIFGVSKDDSVFDRFLFSLNPQAIENALKNETGKTIKEYLGGTL